MNVESLLRSCGVDFDVLEHETEYTAGRTAESLHVPQGHFAKTVVLNVDGSRVLAVVPASRFIDLELVRRELGAVNVQLVGEEEFRLLFPDCELGAIPPFGSEYELETIVDDELGLGEHIVFDGNSHRRAIYMRYRDFVRIEHPRMAHIAN
ncbi:YbaK / prolyl-tRNA synthetases associated domain protein [Thalassoglobus neptunius]|uniref:YbaK / prolyl-tRNA synthetases associated domain protein n=1 Tax=Thalassoglobus neptunius TaxID=1938619 RepID=A0A5C5X3G8_9PLAN|nr:YbaK/EbsC family protein [Thalassoglobus neptunius]TWT56743.1 YbaK / prolyl-tRNA synthetases associated domain protein [Thalassoglobus neptunius]